MKVKEINPEFLVLEYRQEQTDKGYGSCLWARFYFNLDNWELMITSDCGNYGYRWGAGNGETYLELMARCGEHEFMKIGLIDVDGHNCPNLPLMKISA